MPSATAGREGIHELFAEQARRSPQAVAVALGDAKLSYGELDAQSTQVALGLQAAGLHAGGIVGLSVERSMEMVVGLLGILKAGGVYWGLEDFMPDERRRQRVINARPSAMVVRRTAVGAMTALVASAGAGEEPASFPCPVLAIEDLLEGGAESATELKVWRCDPDTVAYLTYTSGSTGLPKGVLVPHRGVARLVKEPNYVSLGPEETLLHLSHLSFDASTFELWGALLNGGRLALMPPGQMRIDDIGEAIRAHGVTTMWLSAGLFHVMVDERLEDLRPLRQLLAGGDVLSPSHVIKARRALPKLRIINGYGPTENTTFSCCYTVGDESELSPSVPIGAAVPGTSLHILDEAMRPVAHGDRGELYVGGDGVACGYVNQAELTAERFFPDPFSSAPKARLYRTGDSVRLRDDGNLEFLGRMDFQVKVRGYRVEPGEIETVLREQSEIRDAVVIVQETEQSDKRLIACLVATGNERPSAQELAARLAEKLPNYMQPHGYVWMRELPLTPNGKVDRAALATVPAEQDEARETAAPLATLLELELIRIWQEVFHRENIHREDNFFALGGDSLLAARMVLEIEKRYECALPIAALFQAQTIEALARRLEENHMAPPWCSLVPLQTKGSRPPLFLVHGIGGDVYGFLDLAGHLEPDQPVYGLQAVGLDGKAPRHASVQAMAAHYVEEIVSFQKEGPYFVGGFSLGGFSLGGLIAYEVAQQLHQQGRKVAVLALLDSEPIGRMPWPLYVKTMASFVPRRAAWHFRRICEVPWGERWRYLKGRVTALLYWLHRNAPRSRAAPTAQAAPAPTGPEGEDYFLTVGFAYRLRDYPGTVDVFVSDESDPSWIRTWKTLAQGGARFHKMAGMHLEILAEPHVAAVAKQLMDVMKSERVTSASQRSPRHGAFAFQHR